MNDNTRIIDTKWYGSKMIVSPHPETLQECETVIVSGAVLVWNGYRFKAYIGVSTQDNEQLDSEEIADWGNIISHLEALAIFGSKDMIIDGKHVSVRNFYN